MNLIYFFLILFIFFTSSFYILSKKRKESIWYSFTFLLSIFNLLMVLFVYLVQENFNITLTILAIIVMIIFLFMPISTLFVFFKNGITLIKKEGFKFTNLLTLSAAIALLFYQIFWPIFADITQNHLFNTIYQFVSFIIIYFSFVLILLTLTNLLNIIHFKPHAIDYYIVLGAGLFGDKVPPLLASRINKGIELQKEQGAGKIVFSGGQGPDEDIPEGEAMSRYALEKGVPPEVILKETKSRSTSENIQFSKEIIDKDWQKEEPPKIAIVTNNYHVLRGLKKAREQNIEAVGYGAKSKFYFSLNAFLREYIAYLQMTYKVHVTIIGLVGILLFAMFFIIEFYG